MLVDMASPGPSRPSPTAPPGASPSPTRRTRPAPSPPGGRRPLHRHLRRYGTLFDATGQFTHILDPRTGGTAPALAGVSVVAATATLADGLATAMLLAPAERRQAILRAAGGIQAIYVDPRA